MVQILSLPSLADNRASTDRPPLNPPRKQPRPYQSQALREIERVFGHRRDVLSWGSTGLGKTLVQCSLAIGRALQGQQIAIVLALRTLPSQFIQTLMDLGWPLDRLGFIGEGKAENVEAPIVVVMAGTLSNRPSLLDRLRPSLVVVDEAHEQYFDRFIEQLRADHWADTHWLWATATPWRLNKREAFTRISEDAVVRLFGTLRQVIDAKFLVPMRLKAEGGIADVAKLELTKSDGLKQADAAKLKTPEFLEKAARLTMEHGGDRYRAAGLCCDIEQCELMAEAWTKLCPDRRCVILHSQIVKGEWKRRMEAWKSGEAWLMLSVGQVLTGFDWPPVDCLVWLRPTSSKCLWIQGCGRVLRISPETGKRDALIIDIVGNVLRVGHPLRVAETRPQLRPSDKEPGASPEKQCPECGEIVNNFAAICPECGYEFTDGQLDLDGGEDTPFGEVPDPLLAKAVNGTRGQLKSAFTRWAKSGGKGNRDRYINALVEQFPGEYQAGTLYHWLRGAVFRSDRSQAAQCEFLRYLHASNPIAPPGWTAHHFNLEFGFSLTDHSEISGHQLLGVPPEAALADITAAYKFAQKDCYDPELSKLLRWAFDRAMATAGGDS